MQMQSHALLQNRVPWDAVVWLLDTPTIRAGVILLSRRRGEIVNFNQI